MRTIQVFEELGDAMPSDDDSAAPEPVIGYLEFSLSAEGDEIAIREQVLPQTIPG